ncbi:MAG: hypothetical protein CO141_00120 [Candidatus Moranbacteria bacterium CG_4_9_14_3_um_filter_42_9]|nr:MAG: hypothetical protein CO141_00120 [Candidatus Moranbacteria bacterium CG_4_9_14_3_um_filter_42_9]
MEISDEKIKEFQEIYKKEYGKELSWKEAAEGARSLLGLAQIAYDSYKEDCFRKRKLKDHPKGFHLDDGKTYSCRICRESISNEQTWWDEGGIKCLHCQKALDKKIIPKSVCKDDESWYATWEFDYYFKIKSPTVRKLVRQGKLKSRTVPNINGGEHFELFLIKDNIGVLPEKPESYLVKDEQDRVHVEYKDVDVSKLLQ